jgi:hypothetical protein
MIPFRDPRALPVAGIVGLSVLLSGCVDILGIRDDDRSGVLFIRHSALVLHPGVVTETTAYIDPPNAMRYEVSGGDWWSEDETVVTVDYVEDINSNDEYFGQIRNQLDAGQDIGRDLIVLTDYMAARMLNLGWLQELDKANMPNVDANLAESLRSPSWDEDRRYSVPWQSGLTGIAYNAKLTDEVRSFEELLTRLGIDEQRVRATIDLVDSPEAWGRLGHDFRVIVHITQWSAEDVLTVPVAALFRLRDGWAVFRVEEGRARVASVHIGRRNNDVAEIVEGLGAGDPVILHPSDRIADGVAVAERSTATSVTAVIRSAN